VVNEGAGVDAQPGILVLTDDEMPGRELPWQMDRRQGLGVGSQRPAHGPEHADIGRVFACGERAGDADMAVRPDLQGPLLQNVLEGADQRGPDAVPPMLGVHHDLSAGGPSHLLGLARRRGRLPLEVGVAREVRAVIREEVPRDGAGGCGCPGGEPVSCIQQDPLGQRCHAVHPRRRLDQGNQR